MSIFSGNRWMVSASWSVRVILALVLCCLGGTAALAQLSTTATITGSVTDATGAVVPNANVTVTDTATGTATSTHTNGDGVYVVSGLNVAVYSVSIAKTGFKQYTVNGVELHPATTATVNGSLAIGDTTQAVTIQAVSSEVETTTSELSSDISGEQVSTLPINGRNYQGLAVLMPGVNNLQQGAAMTTGGRSTNSQLSISGMAVSRSFYALDGVWNENTGNMSQTSVIPNPDSIEEVRVLQNNFSAQYSLMGSSVILLQTKSGGSKFHGTAWEFWRNNDLNSKRYFDALVTPYHQNIFGYNLSGPVFIPHLYNTNRQKTFFFWDQQFVVLHLPVPPGTSSVPTTAQVAGCFGSPIKDPANPATVFPAGTFNGTACVSLIPANRINTSSTAYLQTLYPAPNYGTLAANTFNYYNAQGNNTFQRDDEIKIDHIFTPRFHALA
jgi:Carboxypeptidase regulatory-like domain/TonB-dependent Receptor Plug Domain